MAVQFDAQSFKDLTGTGGTFTHTPVGTPRGIAVLLASNLATTNVITSVSFGGATLTAVATNGFATVGAGEPGAAYLFFKGTAVAASGTVNVVSTNGTYTAWCLTVTANQAWTEIAASAKANGGTVANPAATVAASSADNGLAVGVLFSGVAAPSSLTPNAGFTAMTGSTTGGRTFSSAQSAAAEYGAGMGGGSFGVGWAAAGDDAAIAAALIRETAPSVLPPTVNSPLGVA